MFVEVKTLNEPQLTASTGVYSRAQQFSRVRNVLKGAYAQLPDDGSATLVILVGRGEILRAPRTLIHGDLFGALFGQMQIRFKLHEFETSDLEIPLSLRDMFVQRGKHRRLGCVAGLAVGGMSIPKLEFYVIHNPYAYPAQAIAREDLSRATQFIVDAEGLGTVRPGIASREAWLRMATYSLAEAEHEQESSVSDS